MIYNGIIIFGEMGSGKDTLADILIKNNGQLKKYGLGDVIRIIKKVSKVDTNWIGNERTFMQRVADKLREIDMDILNHFALAKMLEENLEEFKLSKENYKSELDGLFKRMRQEKNVIPIIVGGRTFKDFDYWTGCGFASLGIEVSKEKRLERLEIRDGKEIAKNSDSSHNTERDVAEIIKKCQFKLSNDGSLEDLEFEAKRFLMDLNL